MVGGDASDLATPSYFIMDSQTGLMEVYYELCQTEPSEVIVIAHCLLVFDLDDLPSQAASNLLVSGIEPKIEELFFKI